jgi:hypothetical protein
MSATEIRREGVLAVDHLKASRAEILNDQLWAKHMILHLRSARPTLCA